jgi:hypothetical protein
VVKLDYLILLNADASVAYDIHLGTEYLQDINYYIMKYLLQLLLLIIIQSKTCHKGNKDAVPTSIENKIDFIKKQPAANGPSAVHQYEYNGKKVYFFMSGCCDQYDSLYDETGKYLCAPSGGFAGKGDGHCTDFATKAQHIKLVWQRGS